MSRTRPSTDPLIRRLQPYIDGELDAEAAAAVADEIEDDPALKDMVEEQVSARQMLRELPRETAPQALRARILLELDAVDREVELDEETARKRGWSRLRSFLRGGLVLAPAAAAAGVLFAITRASLPEAPAESPTIAAADQNVQEDISLSALEPQVIGRPQSGAAAGVNLVSLGQLDDADAPMPEVIEYPLNPNGGRALELRQPSRGGALRGTLQRFRGRTYMLSTDRVGRTLVAYDDGRQLHVLMAKNPAKGSDLQELLELADRLRRAPPR